MSEKRYIADKKTQIILKENTEKIIKKVDAIIKENHKRYGIRISKNDSNPDTRCKYIFDAIGMKPAKMNYATMTFDYGDWYDIFFVDGNYPCMLNNDGTEAYKLDPNDYSKKVDGTPSDVANALFKGNAMSAIPLVWVSQYEDEDYEYMIVCDVKYDDSYHAYAHTREDGSIANLYYERMYEVTSYGSPYTLRSISNASTGNGESYEKCVQYAKNNGKQWGLSRFASWNLFEVLLKIMSKTEDSQKAFGKGVCDSMSYVNSGTLNNKGAFYGYNYGNMAMKVFHCEQWWGNYDEMRDGLINIGGKLVVKATPPFNAKGDGYDVVGYYTKAVSGFESKTIMTDKGRFPKEANGSDSMFTCDQVSISYPSSNSIGYVSTGGGRADKNGCGCRFINTYYGNSSNAKTGSLSCEQPLKKEV